MTGLTLPQLYGPNHAAIVYVANVQVPNMSEERARVIMTMSGFGKDLNLAQSRAFDAARTVGGREQQMVRASEHLRTGIWEVIWQARWEDAWKLSWIVARAGLGLATSDLVGTNGYTVEDYIELVGPWTTGYRDLPIPALGEMAA